METNWRGTDAKIEATTTIGARLAREMTAVRVFNAFPPWEYVKIEIVPGRKKVLFEEK